MQALRTVVPQVQVSLDERTGVARHIASPDGFLTGPAGVGKGVAQAAIAPDGQFGEVSLRRDEPADPVLRFCVVQELAKIKLDKPTGERVVLESIPIKFEWSNP